jgi:hypothetical protein
MREYRDSVGLVEGGVRLKDRRDGDGDREVFGRPVHDPVDFADRPDRPASPVLDTITSPSNTMGRQASFRSDLVDKKTRECAPLAHCIASEWNVSAHSGKWPGRVRDGWSLDQPIDLAAR